MTQGGVSPISNKIEIISLEQALDLLESRNSL